MDLIDYWKNKIKKYLVQYLEPTDWPWEIITGLVLVLLFTNNIHYILKEENLRGIIQFFEVVIFVSLFWSVIEGLMFLFTSFLEKGRYNKMILKIKSSEEEAGKKLIKNNLEQNIADVLDEPTKKYVIDSIFKRILSLTFQSLEKPKLTKKDIIGALLCLLFSFLPSFLIMILFLLLAVVFNLSIAIFITNITGLIVLFGFGYKLGSCTNRNKLLTGVLVTLVGIVIIILGIILNA
jgi:hypothetical protein